MTLLLKNQAIQTALLGDWKTAIEINKDLLQEDPKDIDALNRLALALTIIGKIKSAKMAYQKVLEIDPLNPIALRNIKQLKGTKASKNGSVDTVNIQINNKFIEETGKTKVIELLNIAQPNVIATLRTGELINLEIKRLKIFVIKGPKQYVGMLPDDVGKRLIKFIKSGNKYEAYIKGANPHKVSIFIKEVKRSAKYKNQPSFLTFSDIVLSFDKNDKRLNNVKKLKSETSDLDSENDYSEAEEPELEG